MTDFFLGAACVQERSISFTQKSAGSQTRSDMCKGKRRSVTLKKIVQKFSLQNHLGATRLALKMQWH